MNKNFSSVLAAAMLAVSACSLNAQPNFTVTMPVSADNNNTMAYLFNWDASQKLDSALIVDGTVKFSGNVETPFVGSIGINGNRGPIMIIEPGDIVISENGKHASGTPLNDKFESYKNRRDEIVREYRTLDQNDSVQNVKAKALHREYNSVAQRAYEENAGNPLGLFWFLQDAYEMELSQIDAAIAADPLLAASKRVASIRTALKAKTETSEGQHYKDFTVSYNGKEEKLSDYVKPGRYTIVDFWASWCGPCIRQTKVIKELYYRYKDKGLDVIGVAVWDEPDNTFKAIKTHDLPWPCIVNAQTVPTDLYGISGIPCILLVNPEGIIIARDKMGQELIDAVDSVMAGFQPQAALGVSAEKDTAVVSGNLIF